MGKQNYCIDCGAEICRKAMRCHSCTNKKRWADGLFGSEEHRRKLSVATRTSWERGAYADIFDEECRHKKSEATKAAWERGAFEGVFDSDEMRRTRSEITKDRWECGYYGSEEWHRKKSEATKAAWEHGSYDGNSEAIKMAWERGILGDEEHRRKLSEGTRAAWARGDFGNEGHSRALSEAMKKRWARGDFDSVFRSPTNLELQVAAALDIMGIEHISQYRPEGYSRIYDEFIPPDILLEVQGDYFHSEEHFPGICKRDAEKAQWAEENGFKLIEIWEHEIEEYGAWALVMDKGRDWLPVVREMYGGS